MLQISITTFYGNKFILVYFNQVNITVCLNTTSEPSLGNKVLDRQLNRLSSISFRSAAVFAICCSTMQDR